MVVIDGVKFACASCRAGHRSSKCSHTERPLQEIRKKGRPTTQCVHCRELRLKKSVHGKCVCAEKADRKKPPTVLPGGVKDATGAHTIIKGASRVKQLVHDAPAVVDRARQIHSTSPFPQHNLHMPFGTPHAHSRPDSPYDHSSSSSSSSTMYQPHIMFGGRDDGDREGFQDSYHQFQQHQDRTSPFHPQYQHQPPQQHHQQQQHHHQQQQQHHLEQLRLPHDPRSNFINGSNSDRQTNSLFPLLDRSSLLLSPYTNSFNDPSRGYPSHLNESNQLLPPPSITPSLSSSSSSSSSNPPPTAYSVQHQQQQQQQQQQLRQGTNGHYDASPQQQQQQQQRPEQHFFPASYAFPPLGAGGFPSGGGSSLGPNPPSFPPLNNAAPISAAMAAAAAARPQNRRASSLFLPMTAGTYSCFCGTSCDCVGCPTHDPASLKRSGWSRNASMVDSHNGHNNNGPNGEGVNGRCGCETLECSGFDASFAASNYLALSGGGMGRLYQMPTNHPTSLNVMHQASTPSATDEVNGREESLEESRDTRQLPHMLQNVDRTGQQQQQQQSPQQQHQQPQQYSQLPLPPPILQQQQHQQQRQELHQLHQRQRSDDQRRHDSDQQQHYSPEQLHRHPQHQLSPQQHQQQQHQQQQHDDPFDSPHSQPRSSPHSIHRTATPIDQYPPHRQIAPSSAHSSWSHSGESTAVEQHDGGRYEYDDRETVVVEIGGGGGGHHRGDEDEGGIYATAPLSANPTTGSAYEHLQQQHQHQNRLLAQYRPNSR